MALITSAKITKGGKTADYVVDTSAQVSASDKAELTTAIQRLSGIYVLTGYDSSGNQIMSKAPDALPSGQTIRLFENGTVTAVSGGVVTDSTNTLDAAVDAIDKAVLSVKGKIVFDKLVATGGKSKAGISPLLLVAVGVGAYLLLRKK